MGQGFTPTNASAAEKNWMDAVETRLEQMETQQRLFNSSIRGGRIAVYTDDLELVGIFGEGSYGTSAGAVRTAPVFSVLEADTGGFVFLVDQENGWVEPRIPSTFVEDTFVAVTSSTMQGVWKAPVVMMGKGIRLLMVVTVDSGSTGELQIEVSGNQSPVLSLPAGQTNIDFRWDMSDLVSLTQLDIVRINARRVSGAGNINVYAPDYVYSIAKTDVEVDDPTGVGVFV